MTMAQPPLDRSRSSSGWVAFFQRWLVTTLAVLVAAHVVPGIHYDSLSGLLVASFVLGILNSVFRPVLLLLSLPLLLLSLGLFVLFINAGLLYLVAWMVSAFHVDSFASAFGGALVISLVSFALNALTRSPPAHASKPPDQPSNRPPPPGQGPVIDV
jgi:putative membrane protein